MKREISTRTVSEDAHEIQSHNTDVSGERRPHADCLNPKKAHRSLQALHRMPNKAGTPMPFTARTTATPSTTSASLWIFPSGTATGSGRPGLRLYSTARSTKTSPVGIEVRSNSPDAPSAYDVVIHSTDSITADRTPCLPRIWLRCVLAVTVCLLVKLTT